MPIPTHKYYTCEDYYSLPDDTRAELIEGKLYNMAPPSRIHQKLVSELHAAIYNYIKKNNGSCEIYPAPFAVKLNEDTPTIVEPDLSIICDKNKLDNKGCNGAPDWIIEIVSPSSKSHDYITKLNLYKLYGLREYWIVDPLTKTITVYFFEADIFAARYTFQDALKVNIYQDLYIDFSKIEV